MSCAHSLEAGEIGESFLSMETARRLSCDAGVVEVIEGADGMPLSVGRKRRTIAGALERALHRRDGACIYPGCTNRLFLEGHHIKHWADGLVGSGKSGACRLTRLTALTPARMLHSDIHIYCAAGSGEQAGALGVEGPCWPAPRTPCEC
jgi:hypothetical protein